MIIDKYLYPCPSNNYTIRKYNSLFSSVVKVTTFSTSELILGAVLTVESYEKLFGTQIKYKVAIACLMPFFCLHSLNNILLHCNNLHEHICIQPINILSYNNLLLFGKVGIHRALFVFALFITLRWQENSILYYYL